VNVREGDAAIAEEFFRRLVDEIWERPWPPGEPPSSWYDGKIVLVAEEDGEPVGVAVADHIPPSIGHVHVVYVLPERRRRGVTKALLRELNERFRALGATHVTLDTDLSNRDGLGTWRRLGFTDWAVRLETSLDALDARLGGAGAPVADFASIHVQSDDEAAVAAALRKYVPRIGRSAGTAVAGPRNGWIAVYDDLADRDRAARRRLSQELSVAVGAPVFTIALEDGTVVRYLLVERGNVVDEYLSVPEHFGALPPGDVVALGANPTAVARLTGADPGRVRAVARTASSPGELPPAPELVAAIAEAVGVEGAGRGWAEASGRDDVTPIAHG
jgi:ribosomal protein S18 acetylase RimI-like enzyme